MKMKISISVRVFTEDDSLTDTADEEFTLESQEAKVSRKTSGKKILVILLCFIVLPPTDDPAARGQQDIHNVKTMQG
jgi:hypothetical protein